MSSGTSCIRCDKCGKWFDPIAQADGCPHLSIAGLNRGVKIIADVIQGLREYYPALNDDALAEKLRSCLVVPDTGNDQVDYERVRDRAEQLVTIHTG